jgi:hypothetical protein
MVVAPKSATITEKDRITVVFDTDVKAVGYNYNTSDFFGETLNLCNSNGCSATLKIASFTLVIEE